MGSTGGDQGVFYHPSPRLPDPVAHRTRGAPLHARQIIDQVFDGYRRHLVASSPTAATRLGDHSRDADLDDWSPGAVDARLAEVASLRRRLEDVDDAPPSPEPAREVAGDRVLLDDTLARMRFELEGLRLPETDATFYLDIATAGVDELLRRDDLPAGPRQEAARHRAAAVPRLLDQARANLSAVSAPHREVTLLRTPGAADLFRRILPGFAPDAGEVGEAAAVACEQFAVWLGSGADSAAVPDWRLGEQRWNEALRLVLGADMDAEEVWRRGWDRLAELQAEAEELADAVLPGQPAGGNGHARVRAALDHIAADRPTRSGLVPDAASVLDDIKAFLREVDLFWMPDPDTLRVEEVPAFQRGVAVAYLRPAPPLEPDAPHTYYLSPVPAGWDGERATSFLREYNCTALTTIGVHEAYPGHYVHFAAAQRHPRQLRRTLWTSVCAEGWAVYAEREVVRAGFGGAALALTNAKMDMRAVANALLDQALHVHGWDDAAAMALMTEQAYQEPAEAQGKLVRAKVTAGQLSSYFVGGEELTDLRADVATARGPDFDPRAFHDQVLAEAVPPVAVVRRALLGEGEENP